MKKDSNTIRIAAFISIGLERDHNEDNFRLALGLRFLNGEQSSFNMSTSLYVRAVRTF